MPKYSTLLIRYYAFLSLAVALLSILTYKFFFKTYARWHLEATPESVLGRFVELHEADVDAVPEEEDESLPPLDLVVLEEYDENDERDGVEKDVSDEGPCSQAENCQKN